MGQQARLSGCNAVLADMIAMPWKQNMGASQ
jgi:hypothetical protein